MCGNANVWDGQVARLSDTFRCVTYDRRGHTRSPLGDVSQRTVELHADDAAALIGALSLAPCILVGSSGGARIGVDLVRRYSHLFRAAVLSEPPIFGLDPESGGPGILRDLQPKIQASVAAGGLPAAVDAFFDYMCPGLWSQLDDAGKEPYRANCAELLPDLQMPPYQIALADLRRITTITTMVAGMTSLPTLQRVARVIADGLPNGRLVTLEREQIGLFKAIGYRSAGIAWHYVKLALLIAAVGVVIGWGFGAWLGRLLAGVYAEFYKFPFLLFDERLDVFAIAAIAALLAATLGCVQAVLSTLRLPPAVAMAPPVPPVYTRSLFDRYAFVGRLPKALTMAIRNILRRPLRSALTALGIVLATALLVGGMFAEDSVDFLIDATYFRAERQDASLMLARPVGPGGIEAIRRLPGVMAAEPARAVPVVLRHGLSSKRAALVGKPAHTDLSRVVDAGLNPVVLPEHGLMLTETMAGLLAARVGDEVAIELMDGSGRVLTETVSQIVQQFIGLGAYMQIDALNRLLGEASLSDMVSLMVDDAQWDALFAAIKATPVITGVTLEQRAVQTFRDYIGENIGVSRLVLILMASLIVFGVVYNAMRIQLSERARELASLRVLGFTIAEVSMILLSELALLIVLSIPLGWAVGYGLSWLVVNGGFESELFRIPLVIDNSTYAMAGVAVLVAAAFSAYFVQRRIAGLDMIAVLKTRD